MFEPLVVCLDQKDWINLARGYYEKEMHLKKVAEVVMTASETGRVIFPLSITHLEETQRNLNNVRRNRLVQYMVKVSKAYSIIPAPSIIDFEIEDACLRYLGLAGYNLRNFAIGKGLSHMVGAKPDIEVSGPNASIITEDIKKQLLDSIETPEALLTILNTAMDTKTLGEILRQGEIAAQSIEEIRLNDSKITDNELRYRVSLAKFFARHHAPKIASFMAPTGANPRIMARAFKNKESTIRFFQSMPTSYCIFELVFYRDMQRGRRVQLNDLNDIMGLGVALPYSDVVVTERMWHTAIVQRKLDKLYGTKVLKSVKELQPILEDL